ncbi:androgen-dependent TFPI-regulating protein-like isoform X2 [Choristoneura fumiferana]|uniref:androgen-dependent TFPI-regulating protein-like isoform X2 n=1 Tax=Choristoneura fumiferana TaxID=7141 RepID=UPI003D15EF52
MNFTVSKDPVVRIYQKNRWLLITTWFNLLCLVYTPVGIYCDWRELRRTNNVKHVKILNQIRFVFFSSILYPSTMFSDCLFWKLWIKNRELVAPSAIDVLVPLWLQHCLHTFTLAATFLDLLLVPRRRPKNLTLGASILAVFLAVYGVVCARSITNEEYIYPLLKIFSGYQFIVLVAFVSVEHYLFFTTQWFIIEYVWGPKTKFHTFLSSVSLPAGMKKYISEASEAKRIN